MKESTLRQTVNKMLRKLHQHPISVENSAHSGTPDVNYIEGWIELKVAECWPARKNTPFTLDHFRPEQRIWLRKRWQKGGQVHMLLVVGKDWVLLDGETAADHVGYETEEKLKDLALAVWCGRPKPEELFAALEREPTNETLRPNQR